MADRLRVIEVYYVTSLRTFYVRRRRISFFGDQMHAMIHEVAVLFPEICEIETSILDVCFVEECLELKPLCG